MGQARQFLWKKILTREYSFLYVSYGADCFKIMRRVVGTTLAHDFFHGRGKLVTIYRVGEDIERSYRLIEHIAKRGDGQILKRMERFRQLVEKNYALFEAIRRTRDRRVLKKQLIDLDRTFLETLCYYLFFVFLGYGGDWPAISRFLKRHGRAFAEVRNSTIDTDMNKEFPKLFGRYDPRLRSRAAFMKRRELIAALTGKSLRENKIVARRKEYLLIMRNHRVKEYVTSEISSVVKKELAHLHFDANRDWVKGVVAQRGKVRGPAVVIFAEADYRKIHRGSIIVTPMTKPSIEPRLNGVGGIVTNDGGVLSHASIISREKKIPCIVGTIHATDIFKNGEMIELDARRGLARKIVE